LRISSQPTQTTEYHQCPKCQDRELIVEIRDSEEIAVPCECREQKIIDRLIKHSGLTDELKLKSFSGFKITKATKAMFDIAYGYAKDFSKIRNERPNGVAFTGTVGTGKTHLLAAIANNLLTRRVPVLFINTPSLLAELLTAQFSEDRSEMERKIGLVSNVDVAIFDDLAKEKVSEWGQTQYYRIINHRYLEGLPTLFSSNCDWDLLADKLGEATMSRLYEMTRGRVANIKTYDYRLKGE
jgi:DNA replication protein DnaC